MIDHKLSDESGRMAALERYGVLDTAPEKAFEKITSLVQSILEVPISAVSLVDRERQWFKSIQGLETRETPRSISFCTHAIRMDEPLIVPDALEDDRFSSSPLVVDAPNIRSYAGVALQTPDGYNVGALCAMDTKPRDFSTGQLGILKSFASLVVDELELRRIAERDHLTGALSRRGFMQQMENELTRFQRYGGNCALVMLDIDHFKQVNDQLGHPAGDEVLKAVAAACHERLRANDAFGRLGGEEFGILLVDSDQRAALAAAENLRRTIEGMPIAVGAGITVTASFGLALLSPTVSKLEDWLSQADKALYSAKRQGRNRCACSCFYTESVAA